MAKKSIGTEKNQPKSINPNKSRSAQLPSDGNNSLSGELSTVINGCCKTLCDSINKGNNDILDVVNLQVDSLINTLTCELYDKAARGFNILTSVYLGSKNDNIYTNIKKLQDNVSTANINILGNQDRANNYLYDIATGLYTLLALYYGKNKVVPIEKLNIKAIKGDKNTIAGLFDKYFVDSQKLIDEQLKMVDSAKNTKSDTIESPTPSARSNMPTIVDTVAGSVFSNMFNDNLSILKDIKEYAGEIFMSSDDILKAINNMPKLVNESEAKSKSNNTNSVTNSSNQSNIDNIALGNVSYADDPDRFKEKLLAVQDIIDTLSNIAKSEKQRIFVSSTKRVKQLKDTFNIYIDAIRKIIVEMSTVDTDVSTGNAYGRSGYKSSPALVTISNIIQQLKSLDTNKNFSLPKTTHVLKDIKKLLGNKGPLQELLSQINNLSGVDEKKAIGINSAVDTVFSIIDKFNEDTIDEVEDSVNNALKIIGNGKGKNKNDKTLFGVTNSISNLIKFISHKITSNEVEEAAQSFDYIENIFDSYNKLNKAVTVFGLFGLVVKLNMITDEKQGVNKVLTQFIDDTQTLSDYIKTNKGRIQSFRQNIKSIETIIGIYSDLTNALSLKNLILLPIKLEFLKYNAKYIQKTVDSLPKISSKRVVDFVDSTEMMSFINNAFESLNKSIKIKTMLKTAVNVRFMALAFDSMRILYKEITVISRLKDLSKNVKSVQSDIIDPISNLDIQGMSKTMKSFTKIIPFAILSRFGIKSSEKFIVSFSDLLDKLQGVPTKTLNQLGKKKGTLEQILNVTKALSGISKSASVLMVTAILGNIGIKMSEKMVSSFITLSGTLSKLDTKQLEDAIPALQKSKEVLSELRSIAISGAVMSVLAIPAMVGFMTMIPMLFTLNIVLKTANNLVKSEDDIESAKHNIKAIGTVIVTMGIAMLIGAVVGGLVMSRFKEIIGFAVGFGVFTLAVLGSVNLASRGMSDAIKHAKEISHLILVLGGVMLFGAIFGGLIGKLMPNIMIFTFALSMFIFSVVTALNIALKIGGGIKRLEKAAKGILGIIIASSIILLTAGMIVMTAPEILAGAFAFAILLGGFIFGIVAIIKFGAEAMKRCEKSLVYVMAFEIVTAAVLLAPAMMLNQNPRLKEDLITWEGCLLTFIGGVVVAMRLLPKEDHILRASLSMLAIGGFCTLFATSVWILTKASQSVGTWDQVLETLTMGGVMLLGIKTLVTILGDIDKSKLIQGGIVLAAIGVLALGLAGVVYAWAKVSEAMSKVSGKDLGISVGLASGLVLGIGGIAIGLGALTLTGLGGAGLAAGLAAVAAIEGLCAGLAGVVSLWCEVAKKVAEVQNLQIDPSKVGLLMTGMVSMMTAMLPMANPFLMVGVNMAAVSIAALGRAVSAIAEGVAEAANLHYTKYVNGKPAGQFNLTTEDFKKAAVNTKEIVTVLGGAILDIYDENPEIFNTGTLLGDLIGTETKFQKVVRSVSDLGKCTSVIAYGVNSAANLHYTKYVNGRKVGEFNLDKNDFKAAAENTKEIVRTLGRAIIQIYDSEPEIFNTGTLVGDLFGAQTKFQRVVASVTELGNMISKISGCVKDLAAGVITEYDKNGKETKCLMGKQDFENAQVWTDKIVSSMGKMIINTYNAHPEFFTSGSTLTDMLGFNPKFKSIVDTISCLGTMMSNIADGISAFANNKVAVYGKDGKIVTYNPIPPDTYSKAATTINNIVTLMGNSLMNIYDTHPDWFKTSWYKMGVTTSDNQFTAVMETLGGMSKLIGSYADVVQKFANGTVSVYDKNGKEIGKVPMNRGVYTKAANCVGDTVSTLGKALMDAWTAHKDDIFKPETFKPLMSNLEEMSKLIGTYSDEIKDYANMTIKIYDKDGKYKGLRHFKENEFTNAAENIKTVISTMACAVASVYYGTVTDKSSKKTFNMSEIFKSVDGKSGDSWFEVIVRATSKASGLIGTLAEGVKQYASMRIPTYNVDGSKIVGSRELKLEDFTNAGNNIKEILTILVKTVASVWANQENQKLFLNAKSWGSTEDNTNPFYVIASALNETAKMVGESSNAIDSVLKLPSITKPEVYNDLRSKIKTMLTTLTLSIKEVYDEAGKGQINIFDDSNIFSKINTAILLANTTLLTTVTAYKTASGIKQEDINFLVGNGDVKDNKLYKMVMGLTTPIVEVYNSDKDGKLFGQVMVNKEISDFSKVDTIFNRIVGGVKAVSMVMAGVGEAYKDISEISKDYIDKVDEIKNTIYTMILGLVTPISDTLKMNPEAFNDAWSAQSMVGTIFGGIARAAAATATLGLSEIVGSLFSNKNEKTPDTSFMRVVNGIAMAAKVIFPSVAAIGAVSKITVPKNIKDVINRIFTGLLIPIVDISKGDLIDEADDAIDNISDTFVNILKLLGDDKSVYEGQTHERIGILSVYKQIGDLKIANTKEINFITTKLKMLVEGLPKAFLDIQNNPALSDTHFWSGKSDIQIMFEQMSKSVTTIVNTYQNIINSLNAIGGTSGKDAGVMIATTNMNLLNMIMGFEMVFANSTSPKSPFNLLMMTKNKQATDQVVGAFNNLFTVYNSIPQYSSDKDYFIPYLQKLNAEVGNVQHLNEFIKETDTLVRFNDSINKLQFQNVAMLTKLFETFNAFSSRFGNLDKFTQVLATKLAQVLEKLANEIRDSAKTINQAESIQKKRQQEIKKTIEEFKKLAEMGLEVTVKQAEVETSGSTGGTGSSDGSTTTTTEIASQSTGQGSTQSTYSLLAGISDNVRKISRHYPNN